MLSYLKSISNHATFMYNLRMVIAFSGTAFIPYFFNLQILTIPLTLGVVAAALSDIDDRFSVHIRNLILTYVGFFITSATVQLLAPYPTIFAFTLIFSCFFLILIGSLGKRYATISYGCLVVSVYTMLGLDLFEEWYQQPALLTLGAIWYGLLSSISLLLFPVRVVQEKLIKCYRLLGQFLFVKSNLFDVDMTNDSFQKSMIELSLHNVQVTNIFNDTRVALETRLKGDRGQKSTRRSLKYYFVLQDIHERANSAHIDYQALADVFKHRDVLFRFQRILTLQGKACQDFAFTLQNQQTYQHNYRLVQAFNNLNASITQLEKESYYDPMALKALRGLYNNLKEIDVQLKNLESERLIQTQYKNDQENTLATDDLNGVRDVWQRMKRHFNPESGLFRHAMRLSILLVIAYVIIQFGGWGYGSWLLLTILFVCQPNFHATRRRLKLRILGTLAGLACGVFVILFVPSIIGQLLIMVLSGVLFLQLRSQQYAQATLFITLLALINLQLAHPSLDSILPRALFTLGGCFMAWIGVMFLWPDWKYRQLPKVVKSNLQSQFDYFAEIIKHYRYGRNNSLNYRIVRRRANIMDAELASTISTLGTEPNVNAEQKQLAFKFLCLSHTLLSYISALGSHRNQITEPAVIELLEEALQDTQDILLGSHHADSYLTDTLEKLKDQLKNNPFDDHSTIALQQISLILKLLPELSQLTQKLLQRDLNDEAAFLPF